MPAPQDPFDDVGLLLSIASAIAVRNINLSLEPQGLRARAFSVLGMAAAGGDVTQRNVADALNLNPSQVVALVDDLESEGLVARRSHTSDRRARVISATDQGVAYFAEARRVADEALERSLHGLDAAQRDTLRELLQKLIANAQ